ncbi:hypothetical protein D3C81_1004010 [compost metagenome]
MLARVLGVDHGDNWNDQVEKFRFLTDGEQLIPKGIDEVNRSFDLRGLLDNEIDFPQPREDVMNTKSIEILDHNDVNFAAFKAVDDFINILVQHGAVVCRFQFSALDREAVNAEQREQLQRREQHEDATTH